MRTIVYIDGYNLYYGRFKHTNYKWLDVVSLSNQLCKIQNTNSHLQAVKYFTAPIKARFATNGDKAVASQIHYINALKKIYPECFEDIQGYLTDSKDTPMRYTNPPDKTERVETWKLEEKQTDVNIAIHMYRDAARNLCDQQVLISSDTDLVAALEFIKKDFENITIGLIKTNRNGSTKKNKGEYKRSAKSLETHSSWSIENITDAQCANNLLPDKIPTYKKPIKKPGYW